MGKEKPPASVIDPNANEILIPKPKEKRKNNEKRKEKSRDAARCRRSRETDLFTELANGLPIRREEVEQLDKASVMRLAISFLKIHDVTKFFPQIKDFQIKSETESKKDEETNSNNDETDLKETKPFDIFWDNKKTIQYLGNCLDGFLLILSSEGDITYTSESISEYLGISQIDILGNPIWDYIHQCDHDELKEALNIKRNSMHLPIKDESDKENPEFKTCHRDLFIRFKCTLTSRGRSVNIKSASYKVIHLVGHMIENKDGESVLIGVGRPIPHPSNIEIPLGSTTFLTKHSLDMKFTYVDEKMSQELKYKSDDLLGKSLFNYHHSCDSEDLMATFKSALSKGQGETNRYRFLSKYGGYCWLVTQATIVYDKQKPQSVVCVNYMISQLENENEILSYEQFEAKSKEHIKCNNNNNNNKNDNIIKSDELFGNDKNDKVFNQNETSTLAVPIIQKTTTSTTSINNKVSLNLKVINNIKNQKIRETSLSPVRQTLKNFTLNKQQKQQQRDLTNTISSAPSSGVNYNDSKINNSEFSADTKTKEAPKNNNCNNRITNNNKKLFPSGLIGCTSSGNNKHEEIKKPKSVTASVFTHVKPNERNTILLNANAQFYGASRAQSVTASIFKPIPKVKNLPFGATTVIDKNNKLNKNLVNNCKNKYSNNQNSTAIDKQRSEDMNKGFISFTEDGDLTMLKEEPDDLTHLAPTAGDSCLPLDDSTPLFSEMLEGLILPDSYGSLLPDEINSLNSHSQTNGNNSTNSNNRNNGNALIDPFINYRDDTSDTASSPHLLSPGGLSKSPEASSLPSLCSPHSLSQEDEFAFMTMNVEDDIDLSMRAPYIPMNENDDLPLLTDDLMWSAFSDELSLHKDMKDVMQIQDMSTIKNQINQTNHSCYNNTNNNNNTNNIVGKCNNSNNNSDNNNCLTENLNSTISQSQNLQQQSIIPTSILQTANNVNLVNNTNSNTHESSLVSLLSNNNNCNNNNSNNTDDNIINKLQTDNDILCKKRKYIDDNLCDSVDAFSQVFNNKNCSNLDCWSVTDLLQLDQENIQFNEKSQNLLLPNLSNAISTPNQPKQIQQSILSTVSSSINNGSSTTPTIHVPLITIQNNTKINNQLNNLNNVTTLKEDNNSTKSVIENRIINNNFNTTTANKSTTTQAKNINSINNNTNTSQVNTVKLIPHSTIILNGSNLQGNNKRHIIGTATGLDTKRIKCTTENSTLLTKTTTLSSPIIMNGNLTTTTSVTATSTSTAKLHINGVRQQSRGGNDSSLTIQMHNAEIQTTPHLLQQLISAPNPKHQHSKDIQKNQKNISGIDKYNQQKRDGEELTSVTLKRNHTNHLEQLKLRQQLHQQQQQNSPSNSVLKNLLVSGCDSTSPLPPLITDEDISQDTSVQTNQMSPCTYYSRPFSCRNAPIQFIRNCGSNPMIGGPAMLPSPIPEFFNCITQSSSPTITNGVNNQIDNDLSNDSGIDINMKKSLKITFDEVAFDLQKQLQAGKAKFKPSTTESDKYHNVDCDMNPPENNGINNSIKRSIQNENKSTANCYDGNGITTYKASEPPPKNLRLMKNNYDEPMLIAGKADEKISSLPSLVDEGNGSFGTSFLMDFDCNMDTNINDDFLIENWSNSLI